MAIPQQQEHHEQENDFLNAKNEQGLTPLLLAAAAGNDAHSKYLVEQGADVTLEFPNHHHDRGGPNQKTSIFRMAVDCNLVGTLAALLERYPSTSTTTNDNDESMYLYL